VTKAFAYLRVSGKGQGRRRIPPQFAAVKAYAKAPDIRIVQFFREEGVTGARESMDRAGLGKDDDVARDCGA
jgi:DNA invertase Pin-like site-specific DNA recombinase